MTMAYTTLKNYLDTNENYGILIIGQGRITSNIYFNLQVKLKRLKIFFTQKKKNKKNTFLGIAEIGKWIAAMSCRIRTEGDESRCKAGRIK